MPGKSGYGVQRPTRAYIGRFRPRHEYPERVATQFKGGNWHGYPSQEAWLASKNKRQGRKKMEEKKAKRREDVAKEARDIQDLAREFSERAMRVAVAIMENPDAPDSARLQAVEMIHNRGYGKAPVVNTNLNVDMSAKPSELNAPDLDRRIAETLDRVERLTKREEQTSTGEERPTHLREYH